MIYFISDTHFNDDGIIKVCQRKFKNSFEMNKELIENWNKVVCWNDTVYFLGDFSMGSHSLYGDKELLSKLNGAKNMILGNHDYDFMADNVMITKEKAVDYWTKAGFKNVYNVPILFDGFYVLSHEPLNGFFNTQIFANIHGHIHNLKMDNGNYFNASVEFIGYRPISIGRVKRYFNPSYVDNE